MSSDEQVQHMCTTEAAKKHNINIHLYAADTQLHIPFDAWNEPDKANAWAQLEVCIEEIRTWTTWHILKLRNSKDWVSNYWKVYLIFKI